MSPVPNVCLSFWLKIFVSWNNIHIDDCGIKQKSLSKFQVHFPKINLHTAWTFLISVAKWFYSFWLTALHLFDFYRNIELLLEISPYNLEYNETTLTQSVYLEQFADNIANITNTTEKLRHCSLQDDLNKVTIHGQINE